jgi:short-subunit dehydrogenase
MSRSFNDKVIWITGASSGIGEALAYEFAKLGSKLILSSRNEQELNRVRNNCATSEQNLFVLPLDLCSSGQIANKVSTAIQQWGVIDYVIHNAGLASRALIQDTDMDIYRTVMETNFFGPVALTKAVLPHMLENNKGHFVVISSLSGEYGVPRLSAYSSAKHALHGFFESMRAEMVNYKIKVSIIIPGFINTAIIMNALDGKGNPLGRNMGVNEKGMSPVECARKTIRAISSQKKEALIGRSEMLTVYFHRFFPGLFTRFISNQPVKRLKRALPFLFK